MVQRTCPRHCSLLESRVPVAERRHLAYSDRTAGRNHHPRASTVIILFSRTSDHGNITTMFILPSSWHSHCEGSSGAFSECRTAPDTVAIDTGRPPNIVGLSPNSITPTSPKLSSTPNVKEISRSVAASAKTVEQMMCKFPGRGSGIWTIIWFA